MVPEQITHDVFVAATPENVWAFLTEADKIARWFAFDGAEIDLRPGGTLTMTWHEHGTYTAIIETVAPPHTFAYRWARLPGELPGAGNSTLVTFTLQPEGDGVRLIVTESGFRELDLPEAEQAAWAQDNTQGWEGGFSTLMAVNDADAPSIRVDGSTAGQVGAGPRERQSIVREIIVAAPVERVWAVLTEPRHIAQWFGQTAEVEPRAGGKAMFGWEDDGEFPAQVVRFDPLTHFAYRWASRAGAAPDPGQTTLVEFTLEPFGAGTKLRVVESEFEALALTGAEQRQKIAEHTQGWRDELDEMRVYAENLAA